MTRSELIKQLNALPVTGDPEIIFWAPREGDVCIFEIYPSSKKDKIYIDLN